MLLTATVQAGSTTTLAHNCSDVNGDTLTVTSVGPVTGGGTAAVTNPVSGSFKYTAPSNATTATFSYTVDDGKGGTAIGNASITVSAPLQYGFNNVQNLPPPHYKSFETGSTVQLRWQWLNASGVAGQHRRSGHRQGVRLLLRSGAGARCAAGAVHAGEPGQWQLVPVRSVNQQVEFNWKLTYTVGGITKKLPVGTYVVQVINSVTSQVDPGISNNCGGTSIKGALIKVVQDW